MNTRSTFQTLFGVVEEKDDGCQVGNVVQLANPVHRTRGTSEEKCAASPNDLTDEFVLCPVHPPRLSARGEFDAKVGTPDQPTPDQPFRSRRCCLDNTPDCVTGGQGVVDLCRQG